MNDKEILEKVTAICASVFRTPPEKIGPLTRQEDIKTWDSLGHIRLFLALEQQLKIHFELGEIEHARSVGDIVALVKKRNIP